jgi:hypothetical protein
MRKVLILSSSFVFVFIIAFCFFSLLKLTPFYGVFHLQMEKIFKGYNLEPSPYYSPDMVVQIQLSALKSNNDNDQGIETVFNFASPVNKHFTGNFDNFRKILRTSEYESLINLKSFNREKLSYYGVHAYQLVNIIDKNDRKVSYLFKLSLQTKNPYYGCWMTESVEKVSEDTVIIQI